jgi:glycine dehydrogenase subunit 2
MGPSDDLLVFEKSVTGRRGIRLPVSDVEAIDPASVLPAGALRAEAPNLPELSEMDVVRHYTRLSQKNYGIDTAFYPLGSCTMKYNPRVNEYAANLPGFARVHPEQPDATLQGFLELTYNIEQALAEVTGLDAVTLNPSAGAHGELTALMMVRAYHDAQGDTGRTTVLIPDSSHGTNPASCTLAGLKVKAVNSGPDGRVDFDDFMSKLDDSIAVMMITNPSTLGLFEGEIGKIAEALHAKGAFLYMDGANLNAIMGRTRPGDFGVDCMHINLHKTFTQPHGGGGPGAGPVALCEKLIPFMPAPRVVKDDDGAFRRLTAADLPQSIGRVRSHQGNPGVFVRSYTYMRGCGGVGLREVSDDAVLNANYILARLKGAYDLPYDGPCMHEVVFTARRQLKENKVRALDIAKRLIDLGYHPPTVYFPLVVAEALMIEPTETESKDTLDAFCDAMLQIAREAQESPDLLHNAPVTASVTRCDEVRAVKSPCLCWTPPGEFEDDGDDDA